MAHHSLAAAAVVLGAAILGSGAGAADGLDEIFPPTGRQAGAPPGAPGAFRLLLAWSDDALTFTRAERVLRDQAATPSVAVSPGERILVYSTAAAVNSLSDGVTVSASDDAGDTWRHFRVALHGFSPNLPPLVDPDVQALGDGTYRLYLTGAVGRLPGIYAASSIDGFTFSFDDVALSSARDEIIDSATTRIDGTSHMYRLRGRHLEMQHAVSDDGVTFAPGAAAVPTGDNGQPYVLSGGLDLGEGLHRVYGFSPSAHDVRSFTTRDGVTLAPDPGARLTFGASPLEHRKLRDPAVAKVSDGRFLMVFSSRIP